MRAFAFVKIQSPVVCWLFLLFELTLMGYQLFRCYPTFQRKDWVPLLVLLLLVVWNCTLGSMTDLHRLVIVNLSVLLLAVGLMYLTFLNKGDEHSSRGLSDSPDFPEALELPDVANIPEEPTDPFLDNCRKCLLTVREIEVVSLLAKGKTYKEIAELLHISTSTVDSHAQNSYKKAGVNNKTALLHKFLTVPEK
ncbi:DNA-binding CsgD family transcriptional regulator [Pedobacter sp. AK017]|uniref:response regulator transcription factor n=1 Tax=Pedobacter sp. AK017 TaxID=2723073 RepID=UPI00160ED53D|nr:LuxR C-terminal-related transcriptional regulator [Pedobacter sp. AK017]MBB5439144.1 DNA-binding CsgD family transcriptional regulator [Pedobacter sp. AK017]